MAGNTVTPLDLTHLARGWKRECAAVGGQVGGSFEVADTPRRLLNEYFNTWLGCVVRERTYGMLTFEGYIQELRMVIDGVEYQRTLDIDVFHNAINAVYSSGVGARAWATTVQDTSSQATYGTVEYVISLGGTTAAAAEAVRDRHLEEYGLPRTRMSGGVVVGENNLADVLYVSVAGFWATLNWRYRTTTLTDTASALVSTLAAASQFVTAGNVQTNSLSIRLDCYPNPRRLGDLLREVVEAGDASGNQYTIGVYGRRLEYAVVPTAATYVLHGGRMTDSLGNLAVLPLIKPGFLLRNGTQHEALAAYVAETAWDADAQELALRFGEEDSVLVLSNQVQMGVG